MDSWQYSWWWILETVMVALGWSTSACRHLYSMHGPVGGVLHVGDFMFYNRHVAWPFGCRPLAAAQPARAVVHSTMLFVSSIHLCDPH
jgi:hypothetical protein